MFSRRWYNTTDAGDSPLASPPRGTCVRERYNTTRIDVSNKSETTGAQGRPDHRKCGMLSFGRRVLSGSGRHPASTMNDRPTFDRDDPCRCGSIAGRQLCDGSIECVNCGRVTADPFLVAKRTLEASDA